MTAPETTSAPPEGGAPFPPPPWRCATPGCPEPVTSWAREDCGGCCSEACRDSAAALAAAGPIPGLGGSATNVAPPEEDPSSAYSVTFGDGIDPEAVLLALRGLMGTGGVSWCIEVWNVDGVQLPGLYRLDGADMVDGNLVLALRGMRGFEDDPAAPLQLVTSPARVHIP